MIHKFNLRKIVFTFGAVLLFAQVLSYYASAQACYPADLGCRGSMVEGYVCDCGEGCPPEEACRSGEGRSYTCQPTEACVTNPNTACTRVGVCGGDCLPTQICRQGTGTQPNYCDTSRTECTPSCTGTGCGPAAGCPEGMSCNGISCECNPAACGDIGVCRAENAVNQIGYTSFQYPITDFGGLISSIAGILFPTGIGLGFFMIIIAGYKYMVSEGDPAKVKEAQEQLTAAIIGTLFILLSVFILNTIISTVLGV